jgi:hypothetical protein
VRRPVRHLIAAALAVATVAGCADDPKADRLATEEAFLATCAPGRTPIEERVCRCAFDKVTADLSATELERLDRNLRDDPDTVPPEVTSAALECAAGPLTPPTNRPVTTTTTRGRATTTSTTVRNRATTTTERDP